MNELTGGNPGSDVDLSNAADPMARKSSGNRMVGTTDVGWRTVVRIERQLRARY
jgi:hypothetical protein